MVELPIAMSSVGQVGVIVGGVVAVASMLVWLAGLLIVLRGSRPEDRPRILRAYACCQPRSVRQHRSAGGRPREHLTASSSRTAAPTPASRTPTRKVAERCPCGRSPVVIGTVGQR